MNRFPDTRWSLVLQAADADPDVARRAIAAICEAYRAPILGFLGERCRNQDRAEDLCQELFTSLLEGNGFAGARRDRGRFRNYLMGAAMNRLLNDRRDSSRRPEIPIDEGSGNARLEHWEPVERRTAEDAFLYRWALRLVSLALEDVASEYAARGLESYFARLRTYLASSRGEPPYVELAAQFEKREGAVKMDVFRLRARFREALRSRVLEYTPDDEADDEMRCVMFILTAGKPA